MPNAQGATRASPRRRRVLTAIAGATVSGLRTCAA
jgi:hypothetical protein